MANSKGRRATRRSLEGIGLGWLLKTTPPSLGQKTIPFWKRISTAGYAILAFLALLIALMQGYPWLSLQKDESMDPSKPYSSMFLLTNTGYISATDIDVYCDVSFLAAGNMRIEDANVVFPNAADELGHGGYFTLPCMDSIRTIESSIQGWRLAQRPVSEASMKIMVRYTMFHISKFKPLHRTFHLKAIKAANNEWRWIFMD